MFVRALHVVIEEAEIAARVRKALDGVGQIMDLTFACDAGVVKIGGKFQMGLSVPFATDWTAEALENGRKLGVRLAKVSVSLFGLSAANVSAQVMNVLAQKLRGVPGVEVRSDVLEIDPAALLADKGVRLEGRVRRIDVLPGRVEVEVG